MLLFETCSFCWKYKTAVQIQWIQNNIPDADCWDWIDNRLVIKKKTQCKLELQMPETMKLLGSAKNGEWRMKNGEYVQILEVLRSM